MTHNNNNNNNDGIIINDSNSLEISKQQQDANFKLDKSDCSSNNEIECEIKQHELSLNNDLNKTSDNNTSIDEKFNQDKAASKKRKHRRGKKRRHPRYNPYGLSNSEYEKKECERLQRNREKLVKQGKTLAPFNTTQFIMDEHRNEVPVFDSVNSSDIDSDTTAEDKYLSNEFNEEYEIIKLDYYRNLNKEELLNECFQILNELNRLQVTVAKLTNENEKLKTQLSLNSNQNNYMEKN